MTTIDFGKLMQDAGEGFQPVPTGPYNVQVVKSTAVTSSTGKPMIKVQLQIMGGPHDGRRLFDQFVISADNANALSFFFEHMAAFGLDRSFFAANPTMDVVAATLMNRQALVTVSIKQYKGSDKNEVDSYRPIMGGQIGAVGAAPAFGPGPGAAPAPVAPPPAAPIPVAAPVAPVAPPVAAPVAPAAVAPAPVAPVAAPVAAPIAPVAAPAAPPAPAPIAPPAAIVPPPAVIAPPAPVAPVAAPAQVTGTMVDGVFVPDVPTPVQPVAEVAPVAPPAAPVFTGDAEPF